MIRWSPSQIPFFINIEDLFQIHLIHQIAYIQRKMILPQPFPQIRWQQQSLIHVVSSEFFPHGPQFTYPSFCVHDFFPPDSLTEGVPRCTHDYKHCPPGGGCTPAVLMTTNIALLAEGVPPLYSSLLLFLCDSVEVNQSRLGTVL